MFCFGRSTTSSLKLDRSKEVPSNIRIGVVTWNVGNADPKQELEKLVSGFNDELPDMIVIGLQECSYEAPADDVYKPTSNTRIKDHFVRGVAHFLSGYNIVAVNEIGEMKLIIMALPELYSSIYDCRMSREATGIGRVLANKGGLVARLSIGDTHIGFVNSHLAAHEGKKEERNRDVMEILKNTTVVSKQHVDIYASCHHVVWLGDLNYRVDLRLDESHPADMTHEQAFEKVTGMIDAEDWSAIHACDELSADIRQKRIFANCIEGEKMFAPTFKVDRVEGMVYNKKRIPSYCDRVLIHSAANREQNIKVTSLRSRPDVTSSDHKPAQATLSLDVKTFSPDVTNKRSIKQANLQLQFTRIACSSLPNADVTGDSDPYAILTSLDPIVVKAAKTTVLTDNSSPEWRGDTIPPLLLTAKLSDVRASSISLNFFDYDRTSKDDFLGSASISLANAKMVSEGECEFEADIVQFSRLVGTVSGTFKVAARAK